MLDQLLQAEGEGIEDLLTRQIANGLSEPQQDVVRLTLNELRQVEKVQLKRVDRWGKDMFRATIETITAGKRQTLAMLIISDGGNLYWAGRN